MKIRISEIKDVLGKLYHREYYDNTSGVYKTKVEIEFIINTLNVYTTPNAKILDMGGGVADCHYCLKNMGIQT